MDKTCGACGPNSCRHSCDGAFARRGITKVHWECWAKCNLSCNFCYRTKDPALSHEDAERLLRIVASSGASWCTFAGGDPSLRPDIVELLQYARAVGLKTEVQTNAERLRHKVREEILAVNQVGLSIDGPTAAVHDNFRSCPGNYSHVLSLLAAL